jgi:hypothetical protein
VPPAEKQRRHSLILELQKRISKEKRWTAAKPPSRQAAY